VKIVYKRYLRTECGLRILRVIEGFDPLYRDVVSDLFNWPTKVVGPLGNEKREVELVVAGFKPATDGKCGLPCRDVGQGWLVYSGDVRVLDFVEYVRREFGGFPDEDFGRWVLYTVGLGLAFGYTFDSICRMIDEVKVNSKRRRGKVVVSV
jgi:hypothetical protein